MTNTGMQNSKEKLQLKPITELLNEKFYIPSYQRGYRWKKSQVKDLLDDIWNFSLDSESQPKKSFYCLQPVVVSKKVEEWEVLDGQQRLTTILIILEYLKDGLAFFGKKNFHIRYETRPDSEMFLKSIDINKKEENIDYFHICDALNTVQAWFDSKDGNVKIKFLTTLLNDDELGKNVKVIWYDVSDENTSETFAIDIFTRLNIGKIPLTNAELIKALFLQKGNFQEDKASLKQLQIASEWDAIEKVLQGNAFWYFIYNPSNPLKYDNRIEYIFDLMKGKSKDDENLFTFHKFYEAFSGSKKDPDSPADIDGLWLEIKQHFQIFEEWYHNKELYHLIGFLVDCGINIKELIDKAKSEQTKTKTSFKAYLKKEIAKRVNCQIEELTYSDKRIKKILLLFNIQTILSTENTDIRFPFHRYKKENWDIEHVRSQTDKQITVNNREKWATDILEYFTGQKIYSDNNVNNQYKTEKVLEYETLEYLENNQKVFVQRLIKILNSENIEDEEFNNLYQEIIAYFKESDTPENIDSISNLALLDAKTNRSYKNTMFPIKRKTIIENDMNGVFAPICTKNVFLKSYSRKLGEIMYWSKNDADDYLSAIKQTLKEYLPPEKEIK